MRNKYFLLRHGEATHNANGVISSSEQERGSNPPQLTIVGRSAIKKVSIELESDKIDLIYSSPYRRTMETAAIIAKGLGLEVIRDERIRETEMGILDGLTEDEFDEYFESEEERYEKAPEDGENLTEVYARAKEFIDEMEGEYNQKKILVVSHADTLRMLESVLEGVDEVKDIMEMEYFEPGELRALDI